MNLTTSPLAELDALLGESIPAALERERTEFDRALATTSGDFVLFGAGNMGRTIVRKLRTAGRQPLAFADNNPKLWGTIVEGIPVLSPFDAAARYGASATFVIAVWGVGSRDRMAARERQLREAGCRSVITFASLFWAYRELFLPYHVIDQPSKVLAGAATVRKAADLWADEFSLREYVAQIKWRLRGDFNAMSDPVADEIYFPADLFALTENEAFVDCGAFDGDTVRSFLRATASRFQHIAAFEPDPANYLKLRHTVDSLPLATGAKIETHQQATGASDCSVSFAALGTDGSAMGTGDLEVDCVALDTALAHLAPTHIKMDIEGAELEALDGARGVIAKHRPVLAICSYHRQADVWQIPSLIHSIQPDYRFFLRPHLIEGWDVVTYAVSPERTKR